MSTTRLTSRKISTRTGDRTDHDDAVFLVDTSIQEVADAVDVEDPLGDDGAAHQRAEIDADVGDHRDQRVAQGVNADGPRVAEALGFGRADVVGSQVLHQVGPHQPGDVCQR